MLTAQFGPFLFMLQMAGFCLFEQGNHRYITVRLAMMPTPLCGSASFLVHFISPQHDKAWKLGIMTKCVWQIVRQELIKKLTYFGMTYLQTRKSKQLSIHFLCETSGCHRISTKFGIVGLHWQLLEEFNFSAYWRIVTPTLYETQTELYSYALVNSLVLLFVALNLCIWLRVIKYSIGLSVLVGFNKHRMPGRQWMCKFRDVSCFCALA
jgi:hypothetical protein